MSLNWWLDAFRAWLTTLGENKFTAAGLTASGGVSIHNETAPTLLWQESFSSLSAKSKH